MKCFPLHQRQSQKKNNANTNDKVGEDEANHQDDDEDVQDGVKSLCFISWKRYYVETAASRERNYWHGDTFSEAPLRDMLVLIDTKTIRS